MSVNDIACLYFISGVHNKKTATKHAIPLSAMLGKVNDPPFPVMLSVVITNCVALLDVSCEGMKGALLHRTTRNMQVFKVHRQAAQLLFMRCMGS